MIDLHCHILPGIDDGAASLDESLAMARMAAEDGVEAIVATPHTLNGIYTNPVSEVLAAVSHVQAAIEAQGIPIRLYPGSDVHLATHMVRKIKDGEVCTINNEGRYLLLELPTQPMPMGLKDEVFELKLNGITPIITHPERNVLIQNDPDTLYELISMGALAQVTAMSLLGQFGEPVLASARTLMARRLVHIIASDAHSSLSRPPQLSGALNEAVEILGNVAEAEAMVRERPAAILSGSPFECPDPVGPRRGPGRAGAGPVGRVWRRLFGRGGY